MKMLIAFVVMVSSAFAQMAGVTGRVVDTEGRPLPKTDLTLISGSTRIDATTDAGGRFSFSVEPRTYTLLAQHAGYVTCDYGSRGLGAEGQPLHLLADKPLGGVKVVLIPSAEISGRVVDEDGDPVGRLGVEARVEGYFDGKHGFSAVGSTTTNSKGEYRLTGLPAGSYYLGTHYRPISSFIGLNPGLPASSSKDYVDTYYPSAADPKDARRVEVTAGDEITGRDIRVLNGKAAHIRGMVSGVFPAGAPRVIGMSAANGVNAGIRNAYGPSNIAKDGSFDLAGFLPGDYNIMVVAGVGMQRTLATVRVAVNGLDVENVPLVLSPLAKVTGKVNADGVVVTLVSDGPIVGLPEGRPGADRTFSIEGVPAGTYKFRFNALPASAWVKSVTLEGREVLDSGVKVSGNTVPLVVTISKMVGHVAGQTDPGKMITLVPEPLAGNREWLYRQVNADQEGRYSIDNVAPGKYRLYKWDYIIPGALYSAEYLAEHEKEGVAVTVSAP